jgi:predicted Fe-Mo cluster-binding NifX family protein
MKVAVASNDGKMVDLHFGDAEKFIIFKIQDEKAQFHEIREKTDIPLINHTDRWAASLDLIQDCKAVLCLKIGKEPTIELRKMGIKPIQLDCAVKDAVDECSKHLVG